MNAKIAQMAADRIIEALDKGVVPWTCPWVCTGGAKSHITGKPYSLLNQMILASHLDKTSGEFITFNQAKKEGGKVKKGAQSSPIIFWKVFAEGVENEDGELEPTGRKIPYLQYYRVFAIEDVEGIKPKFEDDSTKLPDAVEAVEQAEEIWRAYVEREKITVKQEDLSNVAFYCRSDDLVRLPNIKQFYKVNEYYNTVFHELAHSTGHQKRLNREPSNTNPKAKTLEELVAEISATAICSKLGLMDAEQLGRNADYCRSWRDAIAKDNSLIVLAASRAQKAIELILGKEDEPAQEAAA